MGQRWGGRLASDATAYCKRVHGYTCWLCGYPIAEDDYTVDHVQERSKRPDLIAEPSNWRPAHGRKHPELGCPGNYGRSGRKRVRRSSSWVADGW
jgi:5-methylcytosine-specific restriction endonuclease McrA